MKVLEHAKINDCRIRIIEDDGDVAVWWDLDTPESGICIGVGETRQEAVQQAVSELEAICEALQGPSL